MLIWITDHCVLLVKILWIIAGQYSLKLSREHVTLVELVPTKAKLIRKLIRRQPDLLTIMLDKSTCALGDFTVDVSLLNRIFLQLPTLGCQPASKVHVVKVESHIHARIHAPLLQLENVGLHFHVCDHVRRAVVARTNIATISSQQPSILINDSFEVSELRGVQLPVSAVNAIRADEISIVVPNNSCFLLKVLALDVPELIY